MLEHFPVRAEDFDGPVLITGAGGCIGAWALAMLTRAGVPTVCFDLSEDKRRPALLMSDDDLAKTPWLTGDIADTERVAEVVKDNDIRAIIHLAALQVPFCAADPVAGAKVNVVGTTNVFEAARHNGIKRLAYASSVAAHGLPISSPHLSTLYGAYKLCDEMIAAVYHQDWGVPSVGMRPGIVYGVCRDQGMSSKTTVAILAAAADVPYTMPFSGPVSGLHAGEVACAFVTAVSQDRNEAPVFDINGVPTSVEAWLEILQRIQPQARVTVDGAALPFPADLSDEPLRAYLGDYGSVDLEDGITQTFEAFRKLLARGALSADGVA